MPAKILIVDDSRTIRQQVTLTLGQAGYHILEAEDGIQGLDIIGTEADIAPVISEINKPNMNGNEMLTAVKAGVRNAALPVLMLTTEARADLIQQAKRIG